MEKILVLHEKLNEFNDEELLNEFNNEIPKYGKMNYFPIFALRLPKFKKEILQEISNENNSTRSAYGIIKFSWIPVIAVFDFCEDENIKQEIVPFLQKNWTKENYTDFLNYTKNDVRFTEYFLAE